MHETAHASPQKRRRAARTRQIVDAATRVVVAEGFASLSVQRLAEELDYTPGALYRYFPSKEALISAVVIGIIDDVADGLRAVADQHQDAPPLDRIRALARSWGALASESPNRFAVIMMLMATPQLVLPAEENARPAVLAMMNALAPVRDAIASAQAIGLVDRGDTTRYALVLFAGLQGALLLRKQSHHVPGLIVAERVFSDVLETILCGWAAAARASRGFDAVSEGRD